MLFVYYFGLRSRKKQVETSQRETETSQTVATKEQTDTEENRQETETETTNTRTEIADTETTITAADSSKPVTRTIEGNKTTWNNVKTITERTKTGLKEQTEKRISQLNEQLKAQLNIKRAESTTTKEQTEQKSSNLERDSSNSWVLYLILGLFICGIVIFVYIRYISFS